MTDCGDELIYAERLQCLLERLVDGDELASIKIKDLIFARVDHEKLSNRQLNGVKLALHSLILDFKHACPVDEGGTSDLLSSFISRLNTV